MDALRSYCAIVSQCDSIRHNRRRATTRASEPKRKVSRAASLSEEGATQILHAKHIPRCRWTSFEQETCRRRCEARASRQGATNEKRGGDAHVSTLSAVERGRLKHHATFPLSGALDRHTSPTCHCSAALSQYHSHTPRTPRALSAHCYVEVQIVFPLTHSDELRALHAHLIVFTGHGYACNSLADCYHGPPCLGADQP